MGEPGPAAPAAAAGSVKKLKIAESYKEFQQTLLRYVIPTMSTEDRALFQRMIPRSRGGTFLIKPRSGLEVHNALPLCEQCNTRKGDSDYRRFFAIETLGRIFETLSLLAVDEGTDTAA